GGRGGRRSGAGESFRYRGRGEARFAVFRENCASGDARRAKEKRGCPVCHLWRFPEGGGQSGSAGSDRGAGRIEGRWYEPDAYGNTWLRRRFYFAGGVYDRRGSGAARTVRGKRQKSARAAERAEHVYERAGGSGECGGRDSRAGKSRAGAGGGSASGFMGSFRGDDGQWHGVGKRAGIGGSDREVGHEAATNDSLCLVHGGRGRSGRIVCLCEATSFGNG